MHSYIEFKLGLRGKLTTERARRYDFKNTNWDNFKTKLADMVDMQINDDIDLQSEAAKPQELCKKDC